MPENPEQQGRCQIDQMLKDTGWQVQSDEVNVSAGRGVAVREFPLSRPFGFADYLLYVDGSPVGVVEAKKEGTKLTGYEIQSGKYSEGLPSELPPPRRPLTTEKNTSIMSPQKS